MKDHWIKFRVTGTEKKLIDGLYGDTGRRRSENIRAALLAPLQGQRPKLARRQLRALLTIQRLLLGVYRKVPRALIIERLLVLQKVHKIARDLERLAP